MDGLFVSIFGLGLVFFAAPGPINIETIRQGVTNGLRPAFCVQLGALITELALGIAVLFGLAPLMQRSDAQFILTVVSAVVLLWVGCATVRDIWRMAAPIPPSAAARKSILVGALCAASSPLSPMLWLSVAGIAAAENIALTLPADVAVIGLGYLLGALTWAVLLVVVIGWSRTLVQPHVWRWWNAGSGIILVGYGVHLLVPIAQDAIKSL